MAGNYAPKSSENKAVAERAANAIREYWLSKGARVHVWIEPVSIRKSKNSTTELHYVVKSEGIPL